MKMKKFLAAGIAATLAVSSMAAVASAEEVTFDMGQTKGTIKFNATMGKEVSFLADADGLAPATLSVDADDTLVINSAAANKKVTGITLKVTGIKGTKASSSKTYSYTFENHSGAPYDWTTQKYDGSGKYWVLRAYKDVAPADSFVPSQFVEITQIAIEIACESTVTTATAYDAYGNTNWGENIDGLVIPKPFSDTKVVVGTDAAGAPVEDFNILAAVQNALNVEKGSNTQEQVYKENPKGSNNWQPVYLDADGKETFVPTAAPLWKTYSYYASYSEKSTTVDYPFMAVTDNGDKTLTRQEIGLLSWSDAWTAINGGNNGGLDGDQSYDDNGFGTNPNDFAGLASQVGDFFNKQTNGTITFKFTTAAASTGTSWQNGGVPSTQVGIKNALGDATANDFALFFNYNQTGSLQAVTSIDANAGTVTFDIADVLDALDGKTIGVIDNIYYGMTKGVTYDNLGTGLKVESITLAYDEDAADDTDIEEDDDDATIEDDDDDADVEDDDDDADVEDDDDDAAVEDDDDDDTDVDGDVDEPVTPADDDDDANPGTGVALAVVPALVAAAAVVVSKKRK